MQSILDEGYAENTEARKLVCSMRAECDYFVETLIYKRNGNSAQLRQVESRWCSSNKGIWFIGELLQLHCRFAASAPGQFLYTM